MATLTKRCRVFLWCLLFLASAGYFLRQRALDFYRTRATAAPVVAIGLGLTSKGFSPNATLDDFPFFSMFLKSMCATAAPQYNYRIYIGYDYNDPVLSSPARRAEFASKVANVTCRGARSAANFSCGREEGPRLRLPIFFVRCGFFGKPSWCQNDAMMVAFSDGADYFYRVNDDTEFATEGWPNSFISILASYDPPNLGVVGPLDENREPNFPLTYDFVHRTHIDIFGFYYPREFPHWFADFWIDKVYQPNRTVIDHSTRLRHSMSVTRYATDRERAGLLPSVVNRYRPLVEDRLKARYQQKSG